MNDGFLTCRDVYKSYGTTPAVQGVDLAVQHGQILALLGPSGCGKTTLLRLIAGFERPDAGVIELGGRVLADARLMVPPEKRRVGMVFQDYALFNHMSVAANVRFGVPSGVNKRARAGELLELVGLAGLGRRMPHELSGGQQQRVALARTLAAQPELVLLDEPFSNLDPGLREQVRNETWQMLTELGMTAIIVTHDQEEALSLPGEVAVMLDGRLAQVGTAGEIYRRPASRAVAEFVGDANIVSATASGHSATSELGQVELVEPACGECEVIVRPEHVEMVAGAGVPATIIRREYFGHDQLFTLRLASGRLVRARTNHSFALAPGDETGLRVSELVMAFPHA